MQNKELYEQSLTKLAELIRKREVSSGEVVEAHLEQISALNPALNAIVTFAGDVSVHAEGPLAGVPVTVKDTIETAGIRTTSGSRIRAD
ncbi:MAG TPA: amidase family protein, partial [Pyrinomonadaceae bacterium]